MNEFLSFSTALIAFTFIEFFLILLLCLLDFGPRVKSKERNILVHIKKIRVLLFIFYSLLVTYSAITSTRFTAWFYLHALLVGILTLALVTRNKLSKLTTLMALSIPIVVMLLSLSINGPMPITQDEGRQTGLAYRIIQDGKWMPYTYYEEPYYQFFHVTACIKAILSIITGLDMLYLVHPLIVLTNTLLISFNVYIILKNIMGAKSSSILGPIMLSLTPPLSTLAFIPHTLGMAFCFTSLAAVGIASSKKPVHRKSFFLVILISITGVVTHAMYYPLLLVTLIAILLVWSNRVERASEARLLKSVMFIITPITFTYWIYTFQLNRLVTLGKIWIESLAELILGAVRPFELTRQMYYEAGPVELACSWTLLPALVAAYIFVELILGLRNSTQPRKMFHILRSDTAVSLGTVGILLVGLAFIGRASRMGWATRYFYLAYVLLILAAPVVIGKLFNKKRMITIVLITFIIVASSFYAVQDPLISPDAHKITALANKRAWTVAKSLAHYVSPDMNWYVDQRVGIGFAAYTYQSAPEHYVGVQEWAPATLESIEERHSLFVLKFDRLGNRFAKVWIEETILQAIKAGRYNIIYTDGQYETYTNPPRTVR